MGDPGPQGDGGRAAARAERLACYVRFETASAILTAMSKDTIEGTEPRRGEQRAHRRIEVNAYVDYTGSEVLLFHKIENISQGGICIQAATVEPPGTEVDLVINFPDLGKTIEVKGEVVWASRDPPHNMGIRFVHVDRDTSGVLESYLQQAAKI